MMTTLIRLALLIQAAVFAYAAAAHAGVIGNRNDPGAATAEAIIAAVLTVGLVISLVKPAATRTTALTCQGFALFGTIIGFTLVLTVGPTTTFDAGMHLVMLVLLVAGLAVTYRAERSTSAILTR